MTKETGAKCERLDSNCVDANRKQVDEETCYVCRQKVGTVFCRQTDKQTDRSTNRILKRYIRLKMKKTMETIFTESIEIE